MSIYPPGTWLNEESRPPGCGVASAGRFRVPVIGGFFDRHHHDDELWFIAAGRAKIIIGEEEHYVQAGDIVLTPAGTSHDIVAVYEALHGFFTETGHPAGGRVGHLHARKRDAAGHPVATGPVPPDFPVRSPL